jgi:hypothetical protein
MRKKETKTTKTKTTKDACFSPISMETTMEIVALTQREPGWEKILAWLYYTMGFLDFHSENKDIFAVHLKHCLFKMLALMLSIVSFCFPHTRVTRLGKFLPLGLLFKGPGEFLGQNVVYCLHFKSLEEVWCRYIGLSNWALIKMFWYFLVWQLFWLLFPRIGHIFSLNLLVTLPHANRMVDIALTNLVVIILFINFC